MDGRGCSVTVTYRLLTALERATSHLREVNSLGGKWFWTIPNSFATDCQNRLPLWTHLRDQRLQRKLWIWESRNGRWGLKCLWGRLKSGEITLGIKAWFERVWRAQADVKPTPALAALTLRMPVSSEGTVGEAIEVKKRVEKNPRHQQQLSLKEQKVTEITPILKKLVQILLKLV